MKDQDMNDNYLWDRSGEPDPELQRLEDILGPLGYQPQPLRMPTDIRVGRHRSFYPALAIAAAIALFAFVLGLGLWLHFNRPTAAPRFEAKQNSPTEQKTNEPPSRVATNKGSSQTDPLKSAGNNRKRHRASAWNLVANNRTPLIRRDRNQPEMTPRELAEKQQVLFALRLVSAKLNLAQRRTQGAPQLNTIRNQHKIG